MSTERFMAQIYGLKGKPFRDRIARETWLETWTDREEQTEKWNGIISESMSSNRNHLAFIIGGYGEGKTLSLLRIVKDTESNKRVFPVYLNFKGEERSTKPGLDFIFRVFKSTMDKLRRDESHIRKEAVESVPDELDEVKTILNNICSDDPEISKLALYFFTGEISPSQSEMKKLGIIRKINSIGIANEYLAGLLAFIKALGYSTLLLAIDEFEYLFSLVSRTQQGLYLALLRGLSDFPVGMSKEPGDIANMVLFIAISESGWQHLLDMERKAELTTGPIVPLRRRVDTNGEILLGPFDEEQAKELIEKRLRYNRISGEFENQPLIPFDEDFVKFIHAEAGGALEKIIVRCDHVLDAGLAERIPILGKEFAERVLSERGF